MALIQWQDQHKQRCKVRYSPHHYTVIDSLFVRRGINRWRTRESPYHFGSGWVVDIELTIQQLNKNVMENVVIKLISLRNMALDVDYENKLGTSCYWCSAGVSFIDKLMLLYRETVCSLIFVRLPTYTLHPVICGAFGSCAVTVFAPLKQDSEGKTKQKTAVVSS